MSSIFNIACEPRGGQKGLMLPPNPNLFAGNPLDRAGNQRKDPDWINQQRRTPSARLLTFHKGKPAIDLGGSEPRLLWRDTDVLASLPTDAECVLLGLDEGEPRWAAEVSATDETLFPEEEHQELRAVAFALNPRECAIAGGARWLLDWHRRHKFCARFGTETLSADGGFKRVNPELGTEHFPRHDPVAIVLPIYGDEVCLGRSPHFPEGMYSAFAGFVEACETMEECVVRELAEEVGLTVTSANYLFSQPWPFPSSLMFGFHAQVDSQHLRPDPEEISDARWFSRDEVDRLINNKSDESVFVPPPQAIALQLLRVWLAR